MDLQPLLKEPLTREEALEQGDSLCHELPDGTRIPSGLIPLRCGDDQVSLWVPEPIFRTPKIFFEAHRILIARHDTLVVENMPKARIDWFAGPRSRKLEGGLLELRDNASQGYDSVLGRDIVAKQYLHPASGAVCISANMSMEPRAFMVKCALRSVGWTILACGPEESIDEIVKSLIRYEHALSKQKID